MELFELNWKENEVYGRASNLEALARRELVWSVEHIDDTNELHITAIEYLSLIDQLHEFGDRAVEVIWFDMGYYQVKEWSK